MHTVYNYKMYGFGQPYVRVYVTQCMSEILIPMSGGVKDHNILTSRVK